MKLSDKDRDAFAEIGRNSFLDYTETEIQHLQEIAKDLRELRERVLNRAKEKSRK